MKKSKLISLLVILVVVCAVVMTFVSVGTVSAYADDKTPVEYLVPVYNTAGDPSTGLKEMTTSSTTSYYEKNNKNTTASNSFNVGDGQCYVLQGTFTCKSISCAGNCMIILEDGCNVTLTEGLNITSPVRKQNYSATIGTLTITSGPLGTGKLVVNQSKQNFSGIYTTEPYALGMIINGGSINATGNGEGSGIGGNKDSSLNCYNDHGGTKFIVNNGEVMATAGGNGGAGIGAGVKGTTYDSLQYPDDQNLKNNCRNCGVDFIFNGGIVNAQGYKGAGIGAGEGGSCGTGSVTINGGEVKARSMYNAGIGSNTGAFNNFKWTGGSVQANTVNGNKAIGCGGTSYTTNYSIPAGYTVFGGNSLDTAITNAADIKDYKNVKMTPPIAITIDGDIENGTISTNPEKGAYEGKEVSLSATPSSEIYKFSNDYKVYKTGDDTKTINVSDGKFTMPGYPVTVTGSFYDARHLVTVDSNTTNGTIAYSGEDSKGIEDKTITITSTPSSGYELESLIVTKADDSSVEVDSTVSGNAGSFTMPTYDVNVTATFGLIKYEIIPEIENGSAEVSGDKVVKVTTDIESVMGDTITITYTIDEGYELDEDEGITVEGKGNIAHSVVGNTITFIMPAEDVTITIPTKVIDYEVTFEAKGSKSADYNATNITIKDGATKHVADEVTIEFNLQSTDDIFYIEVQDAEGKKVEGCNCTYTKKVANKATATFTMPAKDVNVLCYFEEGTYISIDSEIESLSNKGAISFEGTYSLNPTGNRQQAGTKVKIIATTELGYNFDVDGLKIEMANFDQQEDEEVTITKDGNDWVFTVPNNGKELTIALSNTVELFPARDCDITVTQPEEGGTINAEIAEVTVTTAKINNWVNIVVTIDPDNEDAYYIEKDNVLVYRTDDPTKTFNVDEDIASSNIFFFQMDGSDVTIEFTFSKTAFDFFIDVDIDNGSVSVDELEEGHINEEVQLVAYPDSVTYALKQFYVYKADQFGTPDLQSPITVDEDGVFTMPGCNVYISAEFKYNLFNINLASDIANGTIAVKDDLTKQNYGYRVKVIATPNDGYEVDTITVKRVDNNEELNVVDGEFTMLDSDVTITATFKAKQVINVVDKKDANKPEYKSASKANYNTGLSSGAIAGIAVGSAVAALAGAYFAIGFTLYKKGKLAGKLFKAIFGWIK